MLEAAMRTKSIVSGSGTVSILFCDALETMKVISCRKGTQFCVFSNE